MYKFIVKSSVALSFVFACTANISGQSTEQFSYSYTEIDHSIEVPIFKSDIEKVYVINPKGVKMTQYSAEEMKRNGATNAIVLNTKFWKAGRYQIIAEGKNGIIHTQQLTIKSKR